MADSPRDKANQRHHLFLEDIIDGGEFTPPHDTLQPGSNDPATMTMPQPPPVAHATPPCSPAAATLNVNGTRFDIGKDTFCHLAPRLLSMGARVYPIDNESEPILSQKRNLDPFHMINDPKLPEKDSSFGLDQLPPAHEFFVERHAPSFVHILDYFQHGELHLPPDVCPYVFKRELHHWGVDPTVMSDCCQRKYLSFLDDQETLREFNTSFINTNYQYDTLKTGKHPSTWTQFRMRMWAILDEPSSSFWAKVYITVAVLFVLLSIFVLVASTENAFTRGLTTEEWLDYFDDDEKEMYAGLLGLTTHAKDGKPQHGKHDDRGDNDDDDDGLDTTTTTSSVTTEESSNSSAHGPPHQGHVGKRSVGDRYEIVKESESNTLYEPPNIQGELDNPKETGGDFKQSKKSTLNTGSAGTAKKRSFQKKMVNGNFKKLLQSLVRTLSRVGETEVGVNTSKTSFDESLQFEIRIVKEPQESETLHELDVPNHSPGYRQTNEPADTNDVKEVDDDRITSPEVIQEELETSEQTVNDFDRTEDDPVSVSLSRHKRAAQDQTNSSGGNHTDGIDRKSCYFITGMELARMVDIAYSAGTLETSSATTTTTELPQNVFAVKTWMSILETVCIVYFTVEFLLRFIFCPNKLRFLFNFFTIVDILSLVCMYTVLLLYNINSKNKYTNTYVDVINCLQVVRVFRFFRLVKDVTGFRVLIFSVKTSWRELLLLLLYIVMLVTIFASLAYYCERDNMGSILRAAWWAIVTMTTVGYGDIAPKSALGRLVGAGCALSGVLLIAVTVPVFVNNFLLFYEHSKILDQQINARNNSAPLHSRREDVEGEKDGVIPPYKRTNSVYTTSTSTSFSRQQSTLSSAATPVETSAFRFPDETCTTGYSSGRQRKARNWSGKSSETSLTRVQPVL